MSCHSDFQAPERLRALSDDDYKYLHSIKTSSQEGQPIQHRGLSKVRKSVLDNCPCLDTFPDEVLLLLCFAFFRLLHNETQSRLLDWANSSEAQYFHHEWPLRLKSSNLFEVVLVLVALYVFESLVHPQDVRENVHPVDDLRDLLEGKWVWPRKELLLRLLSSLATTPIIEDSKVQFPGRELCYELFDVWDVEPRQDIGFFVDFWRARLRGRSYEDSILKAQLIPYECFKPLVEVPFKLKPLMKNGSKYGCPTCPVVYSTIGEAYRINGGCHGLYHSFLCLVQRNWRQVSGGARRVLHWTSQSMFIDPPAREDSPRKHGFKVAVLGDGGVGLSALINRAVHNTFTDEYDPTIHDTYSHPVSVLDESYQLDIQDLSGLEEYGNRALIFKADALILIYSITDKRSLMWVRNLAAWGFIGAVPCALVGTKMDLTKNENTSGRGGIHLGDGRISPAPRAFKRKSLPQEHNFKPSGA